MVLPMSLRVGSRSSVGNCPTQGISQSNITSELQWGMPQWE